LDKFNDLLLQVVDKTVRYVFGDVNAGTIYEYLQKNGCALHEIPTKPSAFSIGLRKILGSGRGQLLGVASVLEEAILEALCAELKIKFDRQSASSFADHIKKLRELYNKRRDISSRPILMS
jgi:hypothetical protein